jgi:hypothetical protein
LEARASTFFKIMTCPLWGDLTKLADYALDNAHSIALQRSSFDEGCAAALPFIKAEMDKRWENGGKAAFQAMLNKEFGDRAVQL